MAMKLQDALWLSNKLAADLTAHRGKWQNYLLTAARIYKYSFPEQLMIYGQRPNATACAEIKLWNDRMGRRVIRGTCGIALIDRSLRKPHVRYVFDVADTYCAHGLSSRSPRPWRIRPEEYEAVSAALESTFQSPEINGLSFDAKLIKISELAVKERLPDYLAQLQEVKADSLLEELDDLNLSVRLRRLMENSVAYTVLTRCGFEADLYYDDVDFEYIFDFSTPAVISVLGRATSDISRVLLLELGRLAGSAAHEKAKRPAAQTDSLKTIHAPVKLAA